MPNLREAADNSIKHSKINPAELLQRVANAQDKQAFRALYQHFAPRLKNWLRKGGVAEGAAEEIIQDTFLAVWQKAALFSATKGQFTTWFYTIARHKRVDKIRKEYYPDIEILPPLPSSLTVLQKDVGDALKNIPVEQSLILRLNLLEGKTHQEIAEQEKIPLGTVKTRARMGLKKLQLLLEY